MEYSYTAYQERQYAQVSPNQVLADALTARDSDQFVFGREEWTPSPYKGYAMLTMVASHPANTLLAEKIASYMGLLNDLLGDPERYYMLPSESYHQTVANTLSAERFESAIGAKGQERQYPQIIGNSLNRMVLPVLDQPLAMKMIGISIFGSCLGLLGVFEDEAHYRQIQLFRESFYSDPELSAYGIKRTRPFIGHITLCYFGGTFDRDRSLKLALAVQTVNEAIAADTLIFYMASTGLYTYPDLAHFYREPHFPEMQLGMD